ncbi:hypothetical protein [Streptomyces sp. CdTB01]|uniref:hypothetical protein n=1 Tax=Streptomyces sp. CdTB01 TaxID=1725411 RepID=UPI000AAB61E3|nr:hypothetical protein [Streptomyces sp. CdTB01]
MTRRGAALRLSVIGAVAAAALSVPTVATAQTEAGSGRDFGQHVATCAQTMGFDATHNPGMHQGFSGWDAAHAC